ncbi:MAG: DNA polymerase III subunit alpha [Deltaproteobacteria bacterium CG11_big_fil_rev_8_21_14_0_20_47_16]|nr:MAG: DNA polymerase III subunit alpha [Deltaproteobacteria bacterium CG11_big_fil_rev_8_21_14_0_20_47_16]
MTTAQPQFAHLHLHTYYSLLDGANAVGALSKRVKELNMNAVAMTDHGNLFAAVEFYTKMKDAGVKPIIGCEIYLMTHGNHLEKTLGKEGILSHLTLLAESEVGYRNLCKLVSRSYLDGFYYKPRVDKEMLAAFSEGLICLSGCLKGEVSNHLLNDRYEDAKKAAEWYAKLFKDRYYIELMRHDLPELQKVGPGLMRIAQELGLPVVATNDCHYLKADQAGAQDALMCISTGKAISDEKRMKMNVDTFYLRSPEEMAELFADCPEAVSNTVEIANRCNFEMQFGKYHFPKFEVPKEKDLDTVMMEQARQGLKDRWPLIMMDHPKMSPELESQYWARLESELQIVKSMGFAGYFLIVADFINYAKSQDIPVGPGRGSAAGSLVAYALKITDINPIPHNLLFERFLNPERVSMPDMDIDFCMRRRDEVIQYVSRKYGNVGQIVTFGKMKAKAVIRDVGRVMGMPYGDVDRIAKLVPNTLNITLEEALDVEPRLKELGKKDPEVGKLLDMAHVLEGFPRHASTHAAGVVISDQPLENFVPLLRGQHGEVVTQYDMKGVEKVGLIKFDFLGLKTLTVIDDAIQLIKKTHNKTINMAEISLSDQAVYDQLSAGNTRGVFQLESSGMTDLVMKLKPTCFGDIVALVALFRPGPLGSGMVDDFINRKHGRTEIVYELPQLEDILKDTYGVIVYQEQVMQIASRLANYTMGESDILRRAMGKKNPAEMAQQKLRFLDGCKINDIDPKKSEAMFELMEMFAEYGFNKSHSAAYALVSYHTAYLKTHYPTEYMAAVMTNEMLNTDKILVYMNDCKDMGIDVLPPDVNESVAAFSVVGDRKIRFGLTAVKNVGEGAIEAIIEARAEGGAFESLTDFCQRVDMRRVNRRVMESLIKCGAFDSIRKERHLLWSALETVLLRAASHQKEKASGQESIFDMLGLDTGKPQDPVDTDSPPWPEKTLLIYEKEALGFYLSGHPMTEYLPLLKTYATHSTSTLGDLESKREVRVGGVVATLKEITTKRGDRMAFLGLEDLGGIVEVVVFSDVYAASLEKIKDGRPLMIIGVAEPGEESVKILASEVLYIDEVPEHMTKSIHFKVKASLSDAQHLESLKKILTQFKGLCPAFLHLVIPDQSETVMALPKELAVTPSRELMLSVNQLFGGNVTEFQTMPVKPVQQKPQYPRKSGAN